MVRIEEPRDFLHELVLVRFVCTRQSRYVLVGYAQDTAALGLTQWAVIEEQ